MIIDQAILYTFIQILKPLTEKVLVFQSDKITLSEIFAQWRDLMLCYDNVELFSSSFSSGFSFMQELINQLNIRFKMIAKNRLILSSVFLDPRFQLLLDENEKDIAKKHLTDLYMCYIHDDIVQIPHTSTTQSTYNGLSQLERLLREKEADTAQGNNQSSLHTKIHDQVSDFDGVHRIPIEENVLSFWEGNKNTYPILYRLAGVVLSVPGTETKIERNFSTLKFTLTRLRNRLGNKELEKILLIKLNANRRIY